MTPNERDKAMEPEEPLSATDEALLPLVWTAAETGGLATTSGDAPTVELVPDDLRDEFEETLECLRQLERVRQEIVQSGEPGGVSPRTLRDDRRLDGDTDVRGLTPSGSPKDVGDGHLKRNPGLGETGLLLSGLPLGKFQIVRELGRGGFAVVYLARDTRLRREVALKVPRSEVLLSESMRERFAREARAAAALNHPGIVPVLEVGQHELECWIAYAYCDGPTLAQCLAAREEPITKLDDTSWQLVATARGAAEVVTQLADAVQHAHSRGILHRDIKPSNVLVEGPGLRVEGKAQDEVARNGVNSSDHQPSTINPQPIRVRLTDFGLAKVFDENDSTTRTGVVMGTADYMAPEQASGRVKDIGVHTDVFALGAILYELLSGRPPFRGSSTSDTLRRVMHEEPPRLAELWHDAPRREADRESRRGASRHTRVPRDLETICAKCLEKDIQRRYSSAGALADDLRRYLAGEPIHARPTGWLERAVKWMRRRPAMATAVGLLLVLLVSLGSFGWWHVLQLQHFNSELGSAATQLQKESTAAKQQTELAEKRAALIRHHTYAADLRLVQQFFESGQKQAAIDLLKRLRPKPDEDDLRSFEWHYWWERCHDGMFPFVGHTGVVLKVGFSRDGQRLLSCGSDNTARIWNADTGEELLRLEHPPETQGVPCFTLSPDGQRCVTGTNEGDLRFWDTKSGELLETRRDPPDPSSGEGQLRGVEYSADGEWLVTAHQIGTVFIRSAKTGEDVRRLSRPHYSFCGLSKDKRFVAMIGTGEPQIAYWEPKRSKDWPPHFEVGGAVTCGSLSGTGHWLAVGRRDGEFRVVNLMTRPKLVRINEHQSHPPEITGIACSRDAKAVLTIGTDQSDARVKLWSQTPEQVRNIPLDPNLDVRCAMFSPDGRTFALGGSEGLLRTCRSNPWPSFKSGHLLATWSVAFSPDGRRLASASDDLTVCLWDMNSDSEPQRLLGHTATVTSVTFSPDGTTLATSSLDRTVKLWEVKTRSLRQTLTGHTERIYHLKFSHDGRWLASAAKDDSVILWEAKTGELSKTMTGIGPHGADVAFSPDDKTLVASSQSGNVLLWDVESGSPRQPSFDNHREKISSLCFSDDGHQLLTGDEHGDVKLWDVESRQPLLTQQAHPGGVRSVLFTPDGKRFISAGEDQTIKLWDRETGQELTILRGHTAAIYGLAITPDGRTLASCSYDGAIKLWTTWPSQTQMRTKTSETGVLLLGPALALQKQLEGDTHRKQRDYSKAIACFREVVTEEPDNFAIVNRLAWILVINPTTDESAAEAIELAQHASQNDPDNLNYRNTLGAAQCRAGQFAEALLTLQDVDQNAPADFSWRTHNLLLQALCHEKLGDRPEAQSAYDNALKLLPQPGDDSHRWHEARLIQKEVETLIKPPGDNS